MKYTNLKDPIPAAVREQVNQKLLLVAQSGAGGEITPEQIFNAYTGKGGLHGLNFLDYKNFHQYTRAKKEVEAGQFFTPPGLCRDIIDLLKPGQTHTIADLTAGKGSFFNFCPVESNCHGCEIDPDAVTITKHLFPNAHIERRDMQYYKPGKLFDIVVGNPPYNLKIQGRTSQHYYFTKAAQVLKPGGLLAVLVPLSFMSDEFTHKSVIKEVNSLFNFILQYKVDPAAFKDLGVSKFQTKVMVFQHLSPSLHPQPYQLEFVKGSTEELHIKHVAPVKSLQRKQRLHFHLEHRRKIAARQREEDKIKKLLFSIKYLPRITYDQYKKCLDYYQQFKTQQQPQTMDFKEWEKTRLTIPKVEAYLKRVLKKQHIKPEDRVEIVKTDHTLKLKAYS
ncbi:MAG: SAM-dependent DNA methyltransferase, partial [bacterium]|nr:SAM-dependent DNA methyltransferase [bacterium]